MGSRVGATYLTGHKSDLYSCLSACSDDSLVGLHDIVAGGRSLDLVDNVPGRGGVLDFEAGDKLLGNIGLGFVDCEDYFVRRDQGHIL